MYSLEKHFQFTTDNSERVNSQSKASTRQFLQSRIDSFSLGDHFDSIIDCLMGISYWPIFEIHFFEWRFGHYFRHYMRSFDLIFDHLNRKYFNLKIFSILIDRLLRISKSDKRTIKVRTKFNTLKMIWWSFNFMHCFEDLLTELDYFNWK